jgi:hypothetical protein
MDPMMMMMLASAAQKMMQPQQPIMPGQGQGAPAAPQMNLGDFISSNPGAAGGVGPPGGIALGRGAEELSGLTGGEVGSALDPTNMMVAPPIAPQEGGAFSPTAGVPGAPGVAGTPAASPLAGLSKLGADVTGEEIEIGKALLGGGTETPPVPGVTAPGTTEAPGTAPGTSAISPPPVTPPAAAPAGADMKSLLSGLGGVKAPPPITPIMHGGNTGGAKPPEVSAKMSSSIALNPILQLLFGGGARGGGLPVPPLGQLLRGA